VGTLQCKHLTWTSHSQQLFKSVRGLPNLPNKRFNPTSVRRTVSGSLIVVRTHTRGLTLALGSASNGKQCPAASSVTAVYQSYCTRLWLQQVQGGIPLHFCFGWPLPLVVTVGQGTPCFQYLFTNVLLHQCAGGYDVRVIVLSCKGPVTRA
jgi:hypothetical protein